jgi:ABC-type phosphate transport system ATPase subunit
MRGILVIAGEKEGEYGGFVLDLPMEAINTEATRKVAMASLLAGEVAEHGTTALDAFSRPSQQDLGLARGLAVSLGGDAEALLNDAFTVAQDQVANLTWAIEALATALETAKTSELGHRSLTAAKAAALIGLEAARDSTGLIVGYRPPAAS